MGIDDNLIGECVITVANKYPGTGYTPESKEGRELEEISYQAMNIQDDFLSPEMIAKRDALLNEIYSTKIRGYVQ